MRLDFTLTPADVHDAMAPLKTSGRPVRPWVQAVVQIYVLLFPWLFVPLAGARTDPARTANLWTVLMPGTITAAIWVVLVLVNRRVKARRPAAAPASGAAMGAGAARVFAAVLLAPVALLVVAAVPALAVVWHPTDLLAVLVGLAPIQATGLIAVAVSLAGHRRRGHRLLAAAPWLARPRSVDATADELRVADGLVDAGYRWPAVPRFLERPTVFVLYNEANQPIVIPRRAFPSPEAEQAFRGLLQTHVGHGAFQSRAVAFPVLPVNQVPAD